MGRTGLDQLGPTLDRMVFLQKFQFLLIKLFHFSSYQKMNNTILISEFFLIFDVSNSKSKNFRKNFHFLMDSIKILKKKSKIFSS